MKDFFNKVIPFANKLLFPFLLITNIFLIYFFRNLPEDISDAINYPKKDTIIVTKTITAQLEKTTDFYYFEGTIKEDSYKFSERFKYTINLPSEIYNGYLTPVKDYSGGEYFMWSKNKLFKVESNPTIRGYFIISNTSNYQHGEKYLQLLIPIVEKVVN